MSRRKGWRSRIEDRGVEFGMFRGAEVVPEHERPRYLYWSCVPGDWVGASGPTPEGARRRWADVYLAVRADCPKTPTSAVRMVMDGVEGVDE